MEALEELFQKHYFDELSIKNFIFHANHTVYDSIDDLHHLLESSFNKRLIAAQTK